VKTLGKCCEHFVVQVNLWKVNRFIVQNFFSWLTFVVMSWTSYLPVMLGKKFCWRFSRRSLICRYGLRVRDFWHGVLLYWRIRGSLSQRYFNFIVVRCILIILWECGWFIYHINCNVCNSDIAINSYCREILYATNIISADSNSKYARNAELTLPQCMLWICLLKVSIKQ
jgi:hypothetical protein